MTFKLYLTSYVRILYKMHVLNVFKYTFISVKLKIKIYLYVIMFLKSIAVKYSKTILRTVSNPFRFR